MNFNKALETLESKFTSGNSISVERATITRAEWDAIYPILKDKKVKIKRKKQVNMSTIYGVSKEEK
jgi:hypothetical protein